MGCRSVHRTNIIDIVQESHKSEPIRAVPRWYGPAGIVLIALGGVLGYGMPSVLIQGLHWYAPAVLEALFYLPALVGLYMVLLHTVVNGWGGKKGKYRDLIATSMMQFQGRSDGAEYAGDDRLAGGGLFCQLFYTHAADQFGTEHRRAPH